jgi:hypothetical protein
VPLKTGTATPWREVPSAEIEGGDTLVYLCDGHVTGNAGLLAEALRADGVVRSLHPAIVAAESATLTRSFYGHVDGGEDDVFCDPDGNTFGGEVVDEVLPCVIAAVCVDE